MYRHLLTHYSPCTLTEYREKSKLHRILVFGLLLSCLVAQIHSPQPLLSLLTYKRMVWGPMSKEKHESIETLPISVFPVCPNIRQPHCEFEPEFPCYPLQALAIPLERIEEDKEMW
jgi:hypothetical protein